MDKNSILMDHLASSGAVALSTRAEAQGFQLLHVTRVESTNEAALRAVIAGADRLWVVADEQTVGRGRHGRTWASPPGNLYASLGLNAPAPPAFTPLLGFVAGLSLVEAILVLAPALRPVLHLKWPNDCLLDGAKLAGILLEGTSLVGGKGLVDGKGLASAATGVAIGIGVNIAHFPEGLDQRATALCHHMHAINPAMLFAVLSERVAENLALFDAGAGFGAIRERWLHHALPLGTALRVRLPSGERHGRFSGIDPAGHLLLETNGAVETVMVGDVFPAEDAISPEAATRNAG